ncbi:hypothetical protein E4U36_004090 [Claviceps purpurea]|nr:hypothetical protein E4U36_004090 [Claviceps purpurea]
MSKCAGGVDALQYDFCALIKLLARGYVSGYIGGYLEQTKVQWPVGYFYPSQASASRAVPVPTRVISVSASGISEVVNTTDTDISASDISAR